jgi:hypothetical protein
MRNAFIMELRKTPKIQKQPIEQLNKNGLTEISDLKKIQVIHPTGSSTVLEQLQGLANESTSQVR